MLLVREKRFDIRIVFCDILLCLIWDLPIPIPPIIKYSKLIGRSDNQFLRNFFTIRDLLWRRSQIG